MFVIQRTVRNGSNWTKLYAATDIDWNTLGATTLTFDTRGEAMEFFHEFVWEDNARVVPLPVISPVDASSN